MNNIIGLIRSMIGKLSPQQIVMNLLKDNATLESLDAMLNSGKDFFKHLKHNAKTQEEVEMIKEAAREIAEM